MPVAPRCVANLSILYLRYDELERVLEENMCYTAFQFSIGDAVLQAAPLCFRFQFSIGDANVQTT